MTAPTIGRLPVRIPGRALADALLAEFEELFAAADTCPRCNKPLPDVVFGYDTTAPPAAHWVNIEPTRFGKLTPSEAYRMLDSEVSPILSSPFRDLVAADASPWLADRLRTFFDGRAAAQRTGTFLHKFTGWSRAAFLHEVFPTARFIHVIRDGRAVANSWLQMPWWLGFSGPERWQWGPLPPELAAQWHDADRSFTVLAGLLWRVLVDACDAARAVVPEDQWLEVRYEDVTAQPRDAFEAMLRFCGLEWCEEFERGLARHRLSAARVDAYRRDLNPGELARMTAAIAPTLEAHGYATAGDDR